MLLSGVGKLVERVFLFCRLQHRLSLLLLCALEFHSLYFTSPYQKQCKDKLLTGLDDQYEAGHTQDGLDCGLQ